MASHLHLTVQEAQAKITYTEFLKWVWYLNWRDTEEFNRQDFYLAQIAAEICKGQVKKPKKIKLKNFLLDFSLKDSKPKKVDPEEQKKRMTDSKRYWLGLTGVTGNKHLKKKRDLPKRKKKKE